MLGARVAIARRSGPVLWRRVRSDSSYASANDPRVLVGLDAYSGPVTVRVTWPSGSIEEWTDLAVDRYTVLREGSAK
jgi:hypothetical protein